MLATVEYLDTLCYNLYRRNVYTVEKFNKAFKGYPSLVRSFGTSFVPYQNCERNKRSIDV